MKLKAKKSFKRLLLFYSDFILSSTILKPKPEKQIILYSSPSATTRRKGIEEDKMGGRLAL
jgi:hypothetical protein